MDILANNSSLNSDIPYFTDSNMYFFFHFNISEIGIYLIIDSLS